MFNLLKIYGTYENDLTDSARSCMSKDEIDRLLQGKAIEDDPARDGLHYVDGRHFGMTDGSRLAEWTVFRTRFYKSAMHFEKQLGWLLNCLQGAYEREQKSKFDNDRSTSKN